MGLVLSVYFPPDYTPNRNGRSESSIRTVYLVARALLRDSPVPVPLWPYALTHACYILARRPTKAAPMTTPWARPSDSPSTGALAYPLGLGWALDASCRAAATKQAAHFQFSWFCLPFYGLCTQQ